MITMEELLTVEEVAQLLKVTEAYVRELLKTKQLKGFKIGNQWRIEQVDLRNYINSPHTEDKK